jgi:hypothetical protein
MAGGLDGDEGAEARRLGASWHRYLEQVGRIQRFRAGSGEDDPVPDGIKLVDYVRDEGWEIVPVGGEREGDEFIWFVENER